MMQMPPDAEILLEVWTMEFRTLRPEELDAWAEHCNEVFTGVGHAVDKEYFLRHYNNDPWRDTDGIFVAVDGGRIASTVRLFQRHVWLLGTEVPMGGIGEVSTKPEYRGQGLAGRLLEMALEKMRRDGTAVSVLLSMYHDFYGRYGWKVIAKPYAKYASAPALPCEGRRLKPDDMPKLMAVDEASEKTDWAVVRTEREYWDLWMPHALKKGVAAVEGADIVAWLAYDLGEREWHAREFKALPGYGHKFDGLCALAAALEGRRDQGFTAPAWYQSDTGPADRMNADYVMVRLVTPVMAGGVLLDSTQKLMEAAGECRDSDLDHF